MAAATCLLASTAVLAQTSATYVASKPDGKSGSATSNSGAADGDTIVLLVPLQLSSQALSSGCWAQFYDEREFKGDVMTVLGPTELKALDK